MDETELKEKLSYLARFEDSIREVILPPDFFRASENARRYLNPHLQAIKFHLHHLMTETRPWDFAECSKLLSSVSQYMQKEWSAHSAAVTHANSRNQPFCLYLRDFSLVAFGIQQPDPADGWGVAFANVNVGGSSQGVSFALSELRERINFVTIKHTKDISLAFQPDQTIPAIRVSDFNWKPIATELIGRSHCVVLHVEQLSPGTLYEVDRLRDAGKQQASIVINCGMNRAAVPSLQEALADFPHIFSGEQFFSDAPGETRLSSTVRNEIIQRFNRQSFSTNVEPLEFPYRILDPGDLGQYLNGSLPEAQSPSDYSNCLFVPPACAIEFKFFTQRSYAVLRTWLDHMDAVIDPLNEEGCNRYLADVREVIFSSFNLGMLGTIAWCLTIYAKISASRSSEAKNVEAAFDLLQSAERFAIMTGKESLIALQGTLRQEFSALPKA